jgi:hypothetical protein
MGHGGTLPADTDTGTPTDDLLGGLAVHGHGNLLGRFASTFHLAA